MTVARCLYCGREVTDFSDYCNHVIKKHKDQIKKTTFHVLKGCDPYSVTRITIEGDDEKQIKFVVWCIQEGIERWNSMTHEERKKLLEKLEGVEE